jgi:lipoprotein NlpD
MVRSVLGRLPTISIAIAMMLLIASCATRRLVEVPVIERSATMPKPLPEIVAEPPAEVATAIPIEGRGAEKRSPYYMVEKGDTLYAIAQKVGRDFKEIVAWNNLDAPYALRVGQVIAVGPPEGEGVAVAATGVPAPGSMVNSTGGPSRAAGPPPAANTKLLKIDPLGLKRPYSDAALAELNNAAPPVIALAAPASTASAAPPVPAAAVAPPEPTRIDIPKTAGEADDASIGWIWPAPGKMIEGFSEAKNKGIDIAGKPGDPVVAAGDGKVVYVGNALRGYGNLVIIKHNGNFLSAYAHTRCLHDASSGPERCAYLVSDQQAVKKGQKIAEMGDTDTNQVKLHFEIRNQGKPVDPLKFLPAR